jgi:methylenetetrahydrofolate dehydrogenase (NADP+) / methenyltetrahydrofolate cyclohydrolase
VVARLLDGRELANARRAVLAARVAALRNLGIVPRLRVFLPSGDEASKVYAQTKRAVAERLGIEVEIITLEAPSTDGIVSLIRSAAIDDGVSGILVESPLPPSADWGTIREALPAAKDVDGAGIGSLGLLVSGNPVFVPATAAAALLLAEMAGDVQGKRVVMIGRSLVVGRPLALMLLARHATVTICHSRTQDLASVAREADVLMVAVGRPGLITGEFIRPGAVVVDIGTNVVDGDLIGDVDAASVMPIAGALSPVPGGVGPLTTTLLLEHVVTAAENLFG